MDVLSWLAFGILLVAIFGVGLIFFAKFRKPRLSAAEIDFVRRQWRMISADPDNAKFVLEADKLLDFVLTKSGYVGTLGEKLKAAEKAFSDVNGVWQAHKLRNKIAHEAGFTPEKNEAHAARKNFKRAFADLQISL